MLEKLECVCELLTPDEIKKTSDNFVGKWGGKFNSYYAIQNSKGVELENNGALLIGWVDEINSIYKDTTDINGSYAVIKDFKNKLSFFCDQFGSRTLWYYLDKALLHKDLKCKAPLIDPNLRRNLGKWAT
nr:hypothetical protein [Acinetobacter indicus]